MVLLLTENTELTDVSETVEEVVREVGEAVVPSSLQTYLEDLPAKALSLGVRAVVALVLLLVGSRLIKLALKLIDRSLERAKMETGARQFVDSFLRVALYVVLAFLIASYLGADAASIVAILGSAGVAIGLALQGSLSNLAGGVLILIVKPFVVGDYIIDSSSGKEGFVTEISIFYTRIKTYDNQVVVLPNGNLSNSVVTNVFREEKRKIDLDISVAYGADLARARSALLEVLETDEDVLKDEPMLVVVDALADSGVNLIVRYWVKAEVYWTARYRVAENCKLALDRAGVEIPFPQVDVHLRGTSGGDGRAAAEPFSGKLSESKQ